MILTKNDKMICANYETHISRKADIMEWAQQGVQYFKRNRKCQDYFYMKWEYWSTM